MARPQKHTYWMEQAAKVALRAACLRSRCGSVIVKDGCLIGRGCNSPPANLESQRRCNTKHKLRAGFKSDKTCCIHAEQRAIYDALKKGRELNGSTIYFIRVGSDGNKEFSGQPYCTICSKLALDAGIKYFALWHKEGIKLYTTEDYNDMSYRYNGE